MSGNDDWATWGQAAMAVVDGVLTTLVSKGVVSPAEKIAIIDQAIASLETNPNLKSAADNIRMLFQRP
jgi:hypothetical protein